MSFSAIVPFSGPAGWSYLSRTADIQKDAFAQAPNRQRDIAYFEQKLPDVGSFDEIVDDRRLLTIALGAFGLDEDLRNKAFLKAVVDGGVTEDDSLANRLADKRYKNLAEAFDNDLFSASVSEKRAFARDIVSSYMDRQFEISVGDSDADLRLALNLQRELTDISQSDDTTETAYFRVLGDPALRSAFETAFGFPTGFSAIDIDQQAEAMRSSVERRFGTDDLGQFSEPEKMDELVQLFLVRASIKAFPTTGLAAQTALRILTA